jgi:hypothetical protein
MRAFKQPMRLSAIGGSSKTVNSGVAEGEDSSRDVWRLRAAMTQDAAPMSWLPV